MKVAKLRKKEQETLEPNNNYSAKSLIKIVILLVVIFCAFYCITILLIDNRKAEDNDKSVSVIDSSKIILNQLLNRNEKEYYVIATKASKYESSYITTNYIDIYDSYINKYKQKENSLTFYYVDLDSALNKHYIGENLNITDNISQLKITDEILFKIKDGSIEKYYLGKDKIIDKLSRL